MNPAELQQPILDGGIRSINFFNGRVLTASDLTREQAAVYEVDTRLGKAIGDGVAYGLEVSASTSQQSTNESPVLTIAPGLAINRRGQTLKLQSATDIGLVRQPNGNGNGAHAFNECTPLQTGVYVAGAGVYLLTVAPAKTTEGLAPTAELHRGLASCNTDTIVSGLQFRLIQLNPPLTGADLADVNYLRNLIAYKCFGVAETSVFEANPFGSRLDEYGLLDGLRPNRLTDCDVPLAIMYWTLSGGIRFVDNWSVRRRLTHRSNAGRLSPYLDDRRASEGGAMFLQFQEHIEDLRTHETNPQALTAKSRFRVLPPVGILPLQDGVTPGFNVDTFLNGVAHRVVEFIDGSLLNALIRQAIHFDPVRLVDPVDPDHSELVWVYSIWQNDKAADEGTPRPYVVFTSGHVPFAATPRFDLARWDYSRYAGRNRT